MNSLSCTYKLHRSSSSNQTKRIAFVDGNLGEYFDSDKWRTYLNGYKRTKRDMQGDGISFFFVMLRWIFAFEDQTQKYIIIVRLSMNQIAGKLQNKWYSNLNDRLIYPNPILLKFYLKGRSYRIFWWWNALKRLRSMISYLNLVNGSWWNSLIEKYCPSFYFIFEKAVPNTLESCLWLMRECPMLQRCTTQTTRSFIAMNDLRKTVRK